MAGQALTLWSYGLAGFAYAIFAIHLASLSYLRSPREMARVAVLLAVMASALWGSLRALSVWADQPLVLVLSVGADQLRYACWYVFFLTLLRTHRPARSLGASAWLAALALGLTGTGLVVSVLPALGVSLPVDSGQAAGLVFMALPVFALVLLEQVYRSATEDSRWNIKPLVLGLAGTFLFDLYLFSQAALSGQPDAAALSIRGAAHALMVPLLLLSSVRRSDWISRIHLSPTAAFHTATLLMAGLYLGFVSGVGYYVRHFGGEWGPALQLAVVFLALVLLMVIGLSGSMRAKLRVFVGKHFFRYRYDYREEWLKFTRTLSSQNSAQEMGQRVVRGLAEMLESPGGGLWTRNRGETAFSQTARYNLAPTLEKEEVDSPLCQFLMTSGWVINLEEFRSFSDRYGALKLPVWLRELPQAWLVVPLLAGEELFGFVVLASARTAVEVNWETIDLLKTAGQQAASFLGQMQATEALLEVRKFDAFNRMSAFVVHDLKNIVTQLSLMMKNAKRLADNPEFQQDMLLTVENSLERMRQLMLQLRLGATPPGTPSGVDLGAIARRIAGVAAARGRHLELQLSDAVYALGHEERLERIMSHVVQNAFDATDPGGRVWLGLTRSVGQARVQVGDTGAGMSQDFIRDRLFKPFQTTKQAGMGIGAYESFQYVQELGGSIDVTSELNAGTTVTIMLPLFDYQKKSEPDLLKNP